MPAIITLAGWAELQHYKDRSPPWVKLYRELLTSESWVLGTDTSRLVQVASMLLAARYNNQIPYRWDLIKKVSSLECTESAFRAAVLHLVAYNFLEIQEVTSEEKPSVQDASNVLARCSSEERRGEERRDRGEKISVELKLDDEPAGRIFEHWRREFGHPKAKLDAKRRKVIAAALASFDEATVCSAISGYKLSPHHMGENDQRTVYDDIELFLRDVSHIERGLNFARAPPKPQMSAVERAREKLRNGNGNGRVVSEQFSGSGESGLGAAAGLLRRIPD
jgi:hypothetical protein